jgi:hypothetical protein
MAPASSIPLALLTAATAALPISLVAPTMTTLNSRTESPAQESFRIQRTTNPRARVCVARRRYVLPWLCSATAAPARSQRRRRTWRCLSSWRRSARALCCSGGGRSSGMTKRPRWLCRGWRSSKGGGSGSCALPFFWDNGGRLR